MSAADGPTRTELAAMLRAARRAAQPCNASTSHTRLLAATAITAAIFFANLAIFPHADAGRPFLLRRGDSVSPRLKFEEEMVMSRMRAVRSVVVGSVAVGSSVMLAPDALAQQAVQWRMEDGGNGHWYQPIFEWLSYPEAVQSAASRGGHLATLTTAQENAFVTGLDLPYLNNGSVFGY